MVNHPPIDRLETRTPLGPNLRTMVNPRETDGSECNRPPILHFLIDLELGMLRFSGHDCFQILDSFFWGGGFGNWDGSQHLGSCNGPGLFIEQ
jgi:hypothetical protein